MRNKNGVYYAAMGFLVLLLMDYIICIIYIEQIRANGLMGLVYQTIGQRGNGQSLSIRNEFDLRLF